MRAARAGDELGVGWPGLQVIDHARVDGRLDEPPPECLAVGTFQSAGALSRGNSKNESGLPRQPLVVVAAATAR